MEPITRSMCKLEEFIWTNQCPLAWQQIKQCYLEAPIPIPSQWTMEFHIHTDASNIAVGAMLAQNPTKKCNQPILYASQVTNLIRRNYTTTVREALATVFAL